MISFSSIVRDKNINFNVMTSCLIKISRADVARKRLTLQTIYLLSNEETGI